MAEGCTGASREEELASPVSEEARPGFGQYLGGKKKGRKIGREEVKVRLFAGNMLLYERDPSNSDLKDT